MALRLSEITREALAAAYAPPAAAAVYQQLREFIPYEGNFPAFHGYFATGVAGSGPTVSTLVLDVTLRLRHNNNNNNNYNNNGTGGGGPAAPFAIPISSDERGEKDEKNEKNEKNNNKKEEAEKEVRLALSFPPRYPAQVIRVQVLGPPRRLKVPYPVMDGDGNVKVECLAMLRGVERPFPLLEVMLALTEQFEVEFPLLSEAAAEQQQQKQKQQQQQQQRTASSSSAAVATALTTSLNNPARAALLQEAAEKVVIDLNNKAADYLETREQSLFYLQRLNESNRELGKARDILAKHKHELEQHLPSVGDVGVLVKKLEAVPNTVEEHGRCLVAQSAAQERALDLIAHIHATDDVLSLLEDGLKNDYFDVDEYVKCVSDVGREQFVARFLCQRALKELSKHQINTPIDTPAGGSHSNSGAVSPASCGSPGPPLIPQKLSGADALKAEFPKADPDVIRDVLHNVNNDVAVARQQLRSMYS